MTPSTLDINPFLPSNIDDPYPLYDVLRREHPVYRIPDTDFYLVSTWELVTEAVSRTGDFSNNLTGVLVRTPDGSAVTFDMNGGGQAVHVLATADEPDHQHQRKLVLPTLVAKRIRALEPVMTEYTQQLWDNGFDGRRIEWVTSVADTLPLQMVATLIGLPAHDVPQLLAWSYDSTELLSGIVTAERLTGVVTSAAELTGYLYSKFREARAHPVDDLLGDLVRCCDAGELSEDVAVLMLVQLVGAGGESTAGLIANSARLLAERPEIQTQLREDPLLVGAFLEETLRLKSPFRGHHRHVNADTTLGGMTLPAGSHLHTAVGFGEPRPRVVRRTTGDEPRQSQSPSTFRLRQRSTFLCRGRAGSSGSKDRDRSPSRKQCALHNRFRIPTPLGPQHVRTPPSEFVSRCHRIVSLSCRNCGLSSRSSAFRTDQFPNRMDS